MSSLPVELLTGVCQSLVDALEKKDLRGEVSAVPELWRRIVYRELEWAASHFDDLTPRHRANCATLVDWHHRHYGYTHEHWLKFYRSEKEAYRRQVVAELCWCANNVDFELTAHHRHKALELLWEVERYAPELYQESWNVLISAPWHD